MFELAGAIKANFTGNLVGWIKAIRFGGGGDEFTGRCRCLMTSEASAFEIERNCLVSLVFRSTFNLCIEIPLGGFIAHLFK